MKLCYILLAGLFLLTACGGTPPSTPTLPIIETVTVTPGVETNTTALATSSPLPTRTARERANEPTITPRPPTPLPTIPTFTPTFDPSTIVTVTPASKAECPQEDPSVIAKFATPNSGGPHGYIALEVLDYLNTGGSASQLRDLHLADIVDLSGDGINEVAYRGTISTAYIILGCKDGKYQDFLDFAGDFSVHLADVIDLNKNGVPEIILYNVVHYGYVDMYIFEWDGNKFRSLINMGKYSSADDAVIDWVSFNKGEYKLIDTNGDGLTEIIVVYDLHQQAQAVLGGNDIAIQRPLRDQTIILGWNGQNFVNIKQGTNDPPQYRFQAVQDGDEQVRYGNYSTALSFYQAAIFDDRLEWWSPERRAYELGVLQSQYESTPTVYATPRPDTTEYRQLAAYAYYRIMLLHTVQMHEADAGTVYRTLEQKFSNDSYGHPYFEMASAFWTAYQTTHKMHDGCAAAIEYASRHPEILIPLGSDYHGGYSHTYVPADVCPFR